MGPIFTSVEIVLDFDTMSVAWRRDGNREGYECRCNAHEAERRSLHGFDELCSQCVKITFEISHLLLRICF